MADEDAREHGTALMFIGLALWVAGLLVVFFLPASVKVGRQEIFLVIVAGLAVAGMVFMVTGLIKRKRAGAEE